MAWTPQQVTVSKIPTFESKTAGYLQDLQTTKDTRADKEKAEARLARQDERVALQYKLTAEERERQKQIRQASWDADYTFKETDYSRDMLQPLEKLRNEKNSALAYLQSDTETSDDALRTAIDSYKASIEDRYPTAEVANRVQKREQELLSYRTLLDGETSDEGDAQLLTEFTDSIYTPRLEAIKKNIAAGKGLTLSQRKQALNSRAVPEHLRDIMTQAEYTTLLQPGFEGAVTRDSLLAGETARAKEARERQTQEINAYDKYVQRMNINNKKSSSSGGSSYKGSTKGMQQAYADIAGLDIGYFDNQDAKNGFQVLQEKHGISPEIAAMVIGYNVENGLLGKSFPSITDDAFTDIVEQATTIKNSLSTESDSKGSGNRVYIDKNKYKYHDVATKSPEELLSERFYAGTSGTSRIPLSQTARENISKYIKANPIVSAEQKALWDTLASKKKLSGKKGSKQTTTAGTQNSDTSTDNTKVTKKEVLAPAVETNNYDPNSFRGMLENAKRNIMPIPPSLQQDGPSFRWSDVFKRKEASPVAVPIPLSLPRLTPAGINDLRQRAAAAIKGSNISNAISQ